MADGDHGHAIGEAIHRAEALARAHQRAVRWDGPSPAPVGWYVIDRGYDGARFRHPVRKLTAIVSAARELDDNVWLHLSVSGPGRVPTWDQLRDAKEAFLGDRPGYIVLPPRAEYVNIHPHVLHVFARLDGTACLPDFTQGTKSI